MSDDRPSYAVKLTQKLLYTYYSIEQIAHNVESYDIPEILAFMCKDMDRMMLDECGFVAKDRQWTAHPTMEPWVG